jgi:hypothetical protein
MGDGSVLTEEGLVELQHLAGIPAVKPSHLCRHHQTTEITYGGAVDGAQLE